MTTQREAVAYVPGSVRFSVPVHVRRTARYQTWHSPHPDMKYCAECLLCGAGSTGHATRAEAAAWGAERHPGWCHVVQGCRCPYPHITAAMAARLGIRGSYPLHLARELFRMAGGTRRYRAPYLDMNRVPFGPSPEQLGDVRVCLGHVAG